MMGLELIRFCLKSATCSNIQHRDHVIGAILRNYSCKKLFRIDFIMVNMNMKAEKLSRATLECSV